MNKCKVKQGKTVFSERCSACMLQFGSVPCMEFREIEMILWREQYGNRKINQKTETKQG